MAAAPAYTRPAHAACREHPRPNGNHPDASSPTRTWPSTKPNTAKRQGANRQGGTPTTRAAAPPPAAYDARPFRPASHSERRRTSYIRRCSRNTSNADPSSEPGCAFTNSMQARPQSSHDCHHSPAGHSSGLKITSSGGGATVNGGLRCLAITAPLRSPKLSKLAVRLGGPFPPPATSRRPGMPLPRTQTRLLTLIRQRQRIDQPTQQQTVILDDLQQRIWTRLPRIASHHQRRRPQLSLEQQDLVTRTARLTQNLDLASA